MDAKDVIVKGAQRTVAYARDAAGRAPAREYLEGECAPKDAARLLHWFRVIADHGERAANHESLRHERGAIFAFKAHQARVAAFREGAVWFLTHGFTKKRDEWPRTELERAERIRAEHLARKGKG